MKIHNALPLLLECLCRWQTLPSREEFDRLYLGPLLPLLEPMLGDFVGIRGEGFYEFISKIAWSEYRSRTLTLDPLFEEMRVKREIQAVENLLKVKLKGEVVLFGAFTMMDGYARFDQGKHRVFLGVDEEHGGGPYLDVLISHELTHVARESQAPVWTGHGLDPKMNHDQFVVNMPVIEHLASEGFSCAVSEILHPGLPAWSYAYQTQDSLQKIGEYSVSIDSFIHKELRDPKGHYYHLYGSDHLVTLPRYSHYVWAWQWMRHVIENFGHGSAQAVLSACSKDWLADAFEYELKL
jgi:hypothetical protein